MKDFIDYLVRNKWAWLLPILVFAAVAVYFATRSASVPESPFGYRAD